MLTIAVIKMCIVAIVAGALTTSLPYACAAPDSSRLAVLQAISDLESSRAVDLYRVRGATKAMLMNRSEVSDFFESYDGQDTANPSVRPRDVELLVTDLIVYGQHRAAIGKKKEAKQAFSMSIDLMKKIASMDVPVNVRLNGGEAFVSGDLVSYLQTGPIVDGASSMARSLGEMEKLKGLDRTAVDSSRHTAQMTLHALQNCLRRISQLRRKLRAAAYVSSSERLPANERGVLAAIRVIRRQAMRTATDNLDKLQLSMKNVL